jgi:hypothetical protein
LRVSETREYGWSVAEIRPEEQPSLSTGLRGLHLVSDYPGFLDREVYVINSITLIMARPAIFVSRPAAGILL